ncbi:uncharacterized protein V6R79_017839 [Siganus canaliculatus]
MEEQERRKTFTLNVFSSVQKIPRQKNVSGKSRRSQRTDGSTLCLRRTQAAFIQSELEQDFLIRSGLRLQTPARLLRRPLIPADVRLLNISSAAK